MFSPAPETHLLKYYILTLPNPGFFLNNSPSIPELEFAASFANTLQSTVQHHCPPLSPTYIKMSWTFNH